MAAISATSAIRIILLLVSVLCQNGQTEQMAIVQAHQVGPLNYIISVSYHLVLSKTLN